MTVLLLLANLGATLLIAYKLNGLLSLIKSEIARTMLQAISDFFFFHKESIYLGCVIAVASGALFSLSHDITKALTKKFFK